MTNEKKHYEVLIEGDGVTKSDFDIMFADCI